MTGVELCRLIRQDDALSTMPVLFLTAHASSSDIVEAFASGADDYVVKPFRAPELGARIFGLLRRARMSVVGDLTDHDRAAIPDSSARARGRSPSAASSRWAAVAAA